MTEAKIALERRLLRENRYAEATNYRIEIRERLKREGKNPTDRRKLSWEAMAARYPAVPSLEPQREAAKPEAKPAKPAKASEPPEPREDPAEMAAMAATFGDRAKPPDLPADILWAYGNLGMAPKPADAPGPGAWALLKWARRNLNRFFEQMVPKALAAAKAGEDESETELVEREKKRIGELKKLLGKLLDEMKKEKR